MRTFPPSYEYANSASEKYPRFVATIVEESDSLYFTSHPGIPSVPGVVIEDVLREPSAVSIRVVPDEGRSEIGAVDFEALDLASVITDEFHERLLDGLGLRGKTVKLYHGFAGADFTQFQLFQTQVIADASYERGVYSFKCADITREQRKDICEPKKATLTASIAVGDTTIFVRSTVGFEMVEHGEGWSDAPSATVGYFRIRDTIYRYTGKTDDSFTGVTQGVLNTRAVPLVVDISLPADQQPKVEEVIYLELPAVKMIMGLLTGTLYGQSGAVLPEHWHLGIDPIWLRESDFTGIGKDLWDPESDGTSFAARFAGLKKTSGKRFLEAELYQLLGCFPLVYSDGTLGIRRMNRVLADAPAIRVLDASNIVSFSALNYDMSGMYNSFLIDWNFDNDGKSTRSTAFIDLDSIALHKQTTFKKFSFKGLYGSRHTDSAVRACIDALRDRYSHPPALLTVNVMPSLSALEVGDIVRVKHDLIRDFVAGGPIDRSFEIQRIRYSAATGDLELELFGSTGPAGTTATTGAGGEGPDGENSAPDDIYASIGTDLSTVVTITGSNPGTVTPGTYDLTGASNLNDPSAVYYYLGDLVVPDGAVINITQNTQLRIKGFLQVNGDINGVGGGLAGAADSAGYGTTQVGTVGALGTTRGMDGIAVLVQGKGGLRYITNSVPTTGAPGGSVPYYKEIRVTDSGIVGMPTDLRGTSGGAGGKVTQPLNKIVGAVGGTGAYGGAGLCIICRGMAIGVSGVINLSGGDAATPTPLSWFYGLMYPGAGAPGCGGGLLVLVDGAFISLPDISGAQFLSSRGACGAPRVRTMTSASGGVNPWANGSAAKEGYLDPSTSDIENNAGSNLRIQYLPAAQVAAEDQPAVVSPPDNLAATGVPNGILLTFDLPDFDQFDSVQVYASTSNDLSGATKVAEFKATSYLHSLAPGSTRYYWIRTKRGSLESTWEPVGPTSGVSATAS